MIVNHLLFADDAVIFAPSAKGLKQLLDICSKFALSHNVVFSVVKSQCLLVSSRSDFIRRPNFQLSGIVRGQLSFRVHLLSKAMFSHFLTVWVPKNAKSVFGIF